MAKENLAGDFSSRGDDAEISAAANDTTKDIDHASLDRRPGRISVGQVLLAISLGLSLLVWLPTRASSQPEQEDRSSKPQLDQSGGRLAADVEAWLKIRDSDDPADYEAYLEIFPDSRLATRARISAKFLRHANPGNARPYLAALTSLRTDHAALLDDGVQQDLNGKIIGGPGKHQQVNAEGPATARTAPDIGPTAAVLILDETRRHAESAAAPRAAMVLPLVQPSGPSGAEVGNPITEIFGLARLKTGLLLLHLLGLALGIGTATLLDLFIARSLYLGWFSKEQYVFVEFCSRIVFAGLFLLWVSGLAFLLHYYLVNPAGLENPKVWAKIFIVVVLSLNGLYIHKVVLPELKRNAGFSVFHRTSKVKRSMMLVSGAVSVVSWYAPLLIGAAKELNFAVSAAAILTVYAAALALAILGGHILYAWLESGDPSILRNALKRDPDLQARRSTPGAIPSAERPRVTVPLFANP